MIKHKRLGFTIVELLIVVVVIAILASVTVVAYSGVKQRTEDSQIINAAQQLQKAYTIAIANGKPAFLGGYSSSYDSSTNVCSGGFGGWVDDASYLYDPSFCTIATVLVKDKHIPASLVKNLPKTNKVYTDYSASNKTLMIYQCTPNNYALLYALNTPRPDQKTQLETTCNAGNSWSPFSTYGMNAGIIFAIPK